MDCKRKKLQRIRAEKEAQAKAEKERERERKRREEEIFQKRLKDLADTIEDYFIRENIYKEYFLLVERLSGGPKVGFWYSDNPVAQKYCEIRETYYNSLFNQKTKEYLKKRGIGIRTQMEWTTFKVHVWIWIL